MPVDVDGFLGVLFSGIRGVWLSVFEEVEVSVDELG